MSDHHTEELRLVRAQRRAAEWGIVLDVTKAIALVLTSVFLFIVIQRPESLMNRKKSGEDIARERAKLMLDLMDEDDPTKLTVGWGIIEAAYSEPHEPWLDSVGALMTRYSSLREAQSKLIGTSSIRRDTARLDSVNTELHQVQNELEDIAIRRPPAAPRRNVETLPTRTPATGWVYYGRKLPSGGWKERYFTTEGSGQEPLQGRTITATGTVRVRERFIAYQSDNPHVIGEISPGQRLRVEQIVKVPDVSGDSAFWWIQYSRQ
jgi:hypothetical protein